MIRGDVWLAQLDPVRGSEQAGTRPVLLLQANALNSFLRTVVVIPFTTNLKWAQFPFAVLITKGDGGLASDSVALCHQVRVSDKSRLVHQLGQISDAAMAKVEGALQVTLGM
ncbi:MAG TPA: type II toxin-antitoxin system PemK/MazF family toxin [Gemmataceae bacterium]|jgi:mRNA interferase MazF|nr:type II toxin-antitoxin system PemK/MazF family toxin [Gemmataceae bacterium]